MQKYIPILKRTKIFAGVGDDEIMSMLSCLGANFKTYKKGEYIFRQGEHITDITVLAEGNLHIQKDDYWGNRSILGEISVGEMFGEAYAYDSGAMLNDVVAVEDSVVIFLDVKRILTSCSNACRFHSIVVQNLFFAISEKNRKLVQKLSHMSKRTTREKLMAYLMLQAKKTGSPSFEIPFDRQELADFLEVDRSGLSNEIAKLRREGVLESEKKQFTLL